MRIVCIYFLILSGLLAGFVVSRRNAHAADGLTFISDPGVRMQNASNPGIYQDKNGVFYLYYRNMVATSTDGLNFGSSVPVNDTNDFRAVKLSDGTYRRYYWDQQGGTPSTVYGLKSKSSKDGVNFTDDSGYRYQLDASDKGTAGIHEFFVDKSGGVVLLYIGDLLGTNNIRRAYSKDNSWTFNFERGNILGDANDGKPGSFIDHKVVTLKDGRRRLYTVRQGSIYSFISNDDGKTFTQEPGTRLAPANFKEPDLIGFSDPVFIKLGSGEWRVYATAFLKGYTPEPGGSQKEIIVSATAAEENIVLKEGDLISASDYGDPDIFIINSSGYKRLFLNPVIFNFYGHLGGFHKVKKVRQEVRDSYVTSGLFRNCEINDEKVYGVEITEEDKGNLRWVNTSGEQAVRDDPDFFKKVFCINNREWGWYPQGVVFKSVKEIPVYRRTTMPESTSPPETRPNIFVCPDELRLRGGLPTLAITKGVQREVGKDEQDWIQNNCSLALPSPAISTQPTNTTLPPPLSPEPAFPPADATPPVLKNLGINLEGLDANGAPGDMWFDPSKIVKAFSEFGDVVKDDKGNDKVLYEFAFTVKAGTKLLAAIDGVITRSGDSEIDLRPVENSEWIVNYDHVVPSVPLGAVVKAGEVIGKPSESISLGVEVPSTFEGTVTKIEYQSPAAGYRIEITPPLEKQAQGWGVASQTGLAEVSVALNSQVRIGDILGKRVGTFDRGFFELALLRYINGDYRDSYRYCPLFAADPNLGIKEKVAALMRNVETYMGNMAIYDELRYTYAPGCIADRVVN